MDVGTETPPYLPRHRPPHLPTPRSALSSRSMSGLEENPIATSSGVAGSSTSSSVEARSADSSASGSDDPANGSEPLVLQPPSKAETTISGDGNTRITVTREQPVSGDRKLTAWCRRFVRRFTPTINVKMCAWPRKFYRTACNHTMRKWTPSEGNKRGTETSGMTTHIPSSCQAERNFSGLAHLIGDLRSNCLLYTSPSPRD